MLSLKKFLFLALAIIALATTIFIIYLPKIVTNMPIEFSDNRPGDLWPCKIFKVNLATFPHPEKIPPYTYSFHVNKLGFRGPEVEIKNNSKIIIILGDGYAFGNGLNSGETISERLDIKLSDTYGKGAFVVLNAGMPGYTLTDEYSYIQKKGNKFKPNSVILVVTNSDIWEMLRQKTMRDKMRTRMQSRWRIIKSRFIKQTGYNIYINIQNNPDKNNLSTIAFNKYILLFKKFNSMVKSWGGKIFVVLEADQWPNLQPFFKNEGVPFIYTKNIIPCDKSYFSVKEYIAAQEKNPDLQNWYLIDGYFGRKSADLISEELFKLNRTN